jgi:hypothetical protein
MNERLRINRRYWLHLVARGEWLAYRHFLERGVYATSTFEDDAGIQTRRGNSASGEAA